MVESVESQFCVDTNSIHLSGYSNGGMFSYYAASRLRWASLYTEGGGRGVGGKNWAMQRKNLCSKHDNTALKNKKMSLLHTALTTYFSYNSLYFG